MRLKVKESQSLKILINVKKIIKVENSNDLLNLLVKERMKCHENE